MRLPLSVLTVVYLYFGTICPCWADWQIPSIELPVRGSHPLISCTQAELERLRQAYRSTGPEHEAVAKVVDRARQALDKPVEFPPRGGQHNQWYQCDNCQMGLITIDDTHHQCPRCEKIYSGAPYDDVIFRRQHGRNLSNMINCAWAYAITGNQEYAVLSGQVLRGYAQRYLQYPLHNAGLKAYKKGGGHIYPQTLDEAGIMCGSIAPAYDLIYNSTALSDLDHQLIETKLIEPMLQNIDKYKAGKSNWHTWHNAAFLWGGAVIGEVDWLRKAITAPGNGFSYQMKASVSGDGMWYENSWGYHFYTLSALVKLAKGARRLGIDVWHHPDLKKMFTLPGAYAMPIGSLPRL